MWDLHRPGLEPVSPALTGGFLTTVPPGKSTTSKFLTLVWASPLRLSVQLPPDISSWILNGQHKLGMLNTEQICPPNLLLPPVISNSINGSSTLPAARNLESSLTPPCPPHTPLLVCQWLVLAPPSQDVQTLTISHHLHHYPLGHTTHHHSPGHLLSPLLSTQDTIIREIMYKSDGVPPLLKIPQLLPTSL